MLPVDSVKHQQLLPIAPEKSLYSISFAQLLAVQQTNEFLLVD
jgi:hypothetical protein